MSFTTALVSFGFLTLVLLFIEIMFTYATKGFGFGFSSNRDPHTEYSALATRIKRTYLNQIESAGYIVPILAAAAFLGVTGNGAELSALLVLLGRLAFSVLYYTGIPFIRVPAFVFGTVPTAYIGYLVLTHVAM